MADRQIRIVPKRRDETDVRRFAEALLDYIASLSPVQQKRLAAKGERAMERREGGAKQKGSAA